MISQLKIMKKFNQFILNVILSIFFANQCFAADASNSSLFNRVTKIWNYEIFSLENQFITISSLFAGFVSLIIGLKIARYIGVHSKRKLYKLIDLDRNSANLISRIIDYLLLAVVIIFVLDVTGVPLTVFTFIGGAVAVSIGLSSQHLVNNFISGISLIVEGKIKVGDLIEFDGIIGRVDSIESRVIEIKTQDNVQIFIPHSKIMQEQVTHWTFNNSKVRLSTSFKIDSSSKNFSDEELEKKILNIILNEEEVLKDPLPQLLLSEFEYNLLKYDVRFWVSLTATDRKLIISKINKEILKLLAQNDISLAISAIRHVQ